MFVKMKHFIYAALLLLTLPFIISCGDDDVELDSYIIGKWHSYKMIGHYPDEAISIPVSKTGEGSQSYIELIFNNGGSVVGKAERV